IWTWNYRAAGWEGGEYALLDRTLKPGARAVRAGEIAQAAERYREELWKAHKEPLVGVLLNWDNDAIWAAISLRGRDHFRDYGMQARVGASRALINGNVPWEYVTVRDLEAGLGPRYQVIYAPAQLGISERLIGLLAEYARQGGRVVIDAPGGAFDEHGKVLRTAAGSPFEKLFGAELADLQYSGNVVYGFEGQKLTGFLSELRATSARVVAKFDSGDAAVTEHRVGAGSAVLLGWDASFAVFHPGNEAMEERLRRYALGMAKSPYASDGMVYRLAAPVADHYFFINDGTARRLKLETVARYRGTVDAVSGAAVDLRAIEVEAYGGRWVRCAK
ncbi:MAG: beta-galactosidase trimerization domain-containing protein, partial [Candidatus Solibacter sp.]|nr:beta-galactosidase trimerization domain-containing protein [Candidatus Solibacter sp.]